MSKVKRDLMKEIDKKVAKKKQLSKELSRKKTIATRVAEFFTEFDKVKKMDEGFTYGYFVPLAVNRLAIQLREIDRKCSVELKQDEDGTNPVVEIRWSPKYILANNCEEVLALDASSAFFQSAIEET